MLSPMSDSNRIGNRSAIDTIGVDNVTARSSSWRKNTGQAAAGGRAGARMLAANTDVESLDKSAPRGTYLDILA